MPGRSLLLLLSLTPLALSCQTPVKEVRPGPPPGIEGPVVAAEFERPAEEHLAYRILLAGIPAASASTHRASTPERCVLELGGRTNWAFDLLYPVRCQTRSIRSERTTRFDLRGEEAGRVLNREILFDNVTRMWWREGKRQSPAGGLVVAVRDAVDPLRFLWRLREDPPRAVARSTVAVGPRLDLYEATFLGHADLTVKAGEYPGALHYALCIYTVEHLLPEPLVARSPRVRLEIFLSADSRRLPLLLRRDLAVGCLEIELVRVSFAPAAREPSGSSRRP